jgi:hypothetical protein
MSAPIGNKFYLKRSKHGRDKLFESPEMLWEAACEYYEWCDKNPWIKYEAIKSGDRAGELIPIPTQIPYTLTGLLRYLGIDENTWQRYRSEESYKDFWAVIYMCDKIIYDNKYCGAAVGAFNANIIARDLGLADKSQLDHTTNGKDFLGFLMSVNKTEE